MTNTDDIRKDDILLDRLGAGHTTSQDDELVARIMLSGRKVIVDTPDAYDYFTESEAAHMAVRQASKTRQTAVGVLFVLVLFGYVASGLLAFYTTTPALVVLALAGVLGFATSAVVLRH